MQNTTQNKKKIVFTTVLTIVLCFALVIGGTVAIFSSKAGMTTVTTAGQVKITAAQKNFQTYSGEWSASENAYVDKATGSVGSSVGTFSQGGTASWADSTLTITNMVPMDKVTFDIDVNNSSNVSIKYQLGFSVEGAELVKGLSISISIGENVNDIIVLGDGETSAFGKWYTLDYNGSVAQIRETITVTIEMPHDAGNEYQNKKATINFVVTAVQGNTHVVDNTPFAG